MNLTVFFAALAALLLMILWQGAAAYGDSFCTPRQLRTEWPRPVVGYPFVTHGGMWADVFIVSPMVAYLMARYRLPYINDWLVFPAAALILYPLLDEYRHAGIAMPEAHAHSGHVTAAGWIHYGYAVFTFWIMVLFYLFLPGTAISKTALITVSALMSVWSFLGVCKFSSHWKLERGAVVQIVITLAVIWSITAFHCVRYYK